MTKAAEEATEEATEAAGDVLTRAVEWVRTRPLVPYVVAFGGAIVLWMVARAAVRARLLEIATQAKREAREDILSGASELAASADYDLAAERDPPSPNC